MKIKLIVLSIIGISLLSGIGYLFSEMYDCLYPPTWMKIPRQYNFVDCLQKYSVGTLPDYTQAREDYAATQARKAELVERFENIPEVKAFYVKYEDANVSVREDHLSYFSGREDDLLVRMNLFFDKNDELDHIDFHCYFQSTHLVEVAQEDIVYHLENRDCKKPGT
jgi:hypothetical protein